MRGRSMMAVVGLVALGAAAVALSAARTARAEWRCFHPPRRSPRSPEGLEVQPASWRTEFGEVKGWYVPPKNGAAVVLTHGSCGDREQLVGEMRLLAKAGFGVLALDWPGSGESDGVVKLGSHERAAFKGAVDWLVQQKDVRPERVGAYGISIGGAMVTAFSAEDRRVSAVVAAGGFTDALVQTAYEVRTAWPWSRAAVPWVVRTHLEGGNIRPIEGAAKLRDRRTLFVTFEQDPLVPPQMSDELAAATGGEVYRITGEGHGTYVEHGGDAYAQKLVSFFDQALVQGR